MAAPGSHVAEVEPMEAHKLETVADLLANPEERVELIGGEIVRRPMARGEHGMVQGATHDELSLLQRKDGPGGWWIATEISVAYEAHECPTHDLAGWRKERMPNRPRGVVELTPDWVCEIVSPGHERKDTLTLFSAAATPKRALLLADLAGEPHPDRLPIRRRALPRRRHHHRARPRAHPAVRWRRDGPGLHPRRIAVFDRVLRMTSTA
jgi:hypothetical protein